MNQSSLAQEAARRVMILDENVLDVINAHRALKERGYEVVRMSSPNGALAKLDFERPEILLLDITMNRLNAKALLKAVRNEPDFEELIIVLFSNLDADSLQDLCVEHDIHGYYCKSMGIKEVGAFLDKFYEGEDLEDEEDVVPVGALALDDDDDDEEVVELGFAEAVDLDVDAFELSDDDDDEEFGLDDDFF